MIVANRFWAPLLKYGATNESRKVHVPVEAVYSVIEIKQMLAEDSLDKAMEKLVMYKGLKRDRSEYGRLVENHVIEQFEEPGSSLNRRFDIVFAIGCEDKADVKLVERFFKINAQLEPSLRVNTLVILGSGFACYVSESPAGEHWEHLYPESDMTYFQGWTPKTISPIYLKSEQDTLFHLYSNLQQHLNLTVLNFKNIKLLYGRDNAVRTEHPIDLS